MIVVFKTSEGIFHVSGMKYDAPTSNNFKGDEKIFKLLIAFSVQTYLTYKI